MQWTRQSGVRLKQAIGSPTIPSVPHWQTIASALKLSLTADITLQQRPQIIIQIITQNLYSNIKSKDTEALNGVSENSLNKWVYKRHLSISVELQRRTVSGSEFQIDGAATQNACQNMSIVIFGTVNRGAWDDSYSVRQNISPPHSPHTPVMCSENYCTISDIRKKLS